MSAAKRKSPFRRWPTTQPAAASVVLEIISSCGEEATTSLRGGQIELRGLCECVCVCVTQIPRIFSEQVSKIVWCKSTFEADARGKTPGQLANPGKARSAKIQWEN